MHLTINCIYCSAVACLPWAWPRARQILFYRNAQQFLFYKYARSNKARTQAVCTYECVFLAKLQKIVSSYLYICRYSAFCTLIKHKLLFYMNTYMCNYLYRSILLLFFNCLIMWWAQNAPHLLICHAPHRLRSITYPFLSSFLSLLSGKEVLWVIGYVKKRNQ